MKNFNCFIAGLVAGLAAALAATARAEDVSPAGMAAAHVSAAGHVHLQRSPTHLRMYFQLAGKGKTLEEALAVLKERREAAAAQLEKLGVDKDAVVFAPAGVDDSAAAQQRKMEAMIAQRMGGRGKKSAKAAKPPVAVASLLTATWPLAGDTPEKLLLAADGIREKVKAAELGGKETQKLSPEDQEVAEEMAGQAPNMYGGNEEEAVKPGEPYFVFVAQLSPQDRAAALAEAFAKAKAQAAELAKAAGAGLGPLTGLGGDAQNGGFSPYGRFNPYGYNRGDFMQQIAQAAGANEKQGEITAPKLDGIGFDFVVNATFAVEPGKAAK